LIDKFQVFWKFEGVFHQKEHAPREDEVHENDATVDATRRQQEKRRESKMVVSFNLKRYATRGKNRK
jgi:hypothetical protein